jgi:hypothetical protein
MKALVGDARLALADILGPSPALKAIAARDSPIEEHVITRPYMSYVAAAGSYDAGALMPHDHATLPRHRIKIRVAYTTGFDFD